MCVPQVDHDAVVTAEPGLQFHGLGGIEREVGAQPQVGRDLLLLDTEFGQNPSQFFHDVALTAQQELSDT